MELSGSDTNYGNNYFGDADSDSNYGNNYFGDSIHVSTTLACHNLLYINAKTVQ